VARAKAKAADAAPAPPHAPTRGRTQRPPNRRPFGPHASPGCPTALPQPGGRPPPHGEVSPHARETHTVSDLVTPNNWFDSTRGFPGEGPPGIVATPWFLATVTTRDLVDGKRRRLGGAPSRAAPTDHKLDFGAISRPEFLGRADTALGRFLKTHKGRARSLPSPPPDASRTTPVPRVPPPTARGLCMPSRAAGLSEPSSSRPRRRVPAQVVHLSLRRIARHGRRLLRGGVEGSQEWL
jgi:hypothetical protein